MRYIDLYNGSIKPDEKEYKESIIEYLCDYFCHNKFTLILTGIANNFKIEDPSNTIVFLSGNEYSIVPEYHSSVRGIFTDFWLPNMPENVYEIPLGINERSDSRFIQFNNEIKPISSREYDLCFIGSVHGNSASHRLEMLDSLNNIQKFKKYINPYQNFFYQYEDIEKNKKIYRDILLNTKISLCPGGAKTIDYGKLFSGWESYRFNESLRYGNIIICNYNWSKYYVGPNIFYIENWSDLTEDYISNILQQPLDIIQQRGIENYKQHISRPAVLRNIINQIERLIK